MPISLYDAVVPSNVQILRAVDGLVGKAAAFCADRGIGEGVIVGARLAPDMLPFGYQVKSCAVHSVGGIEGTRAARFQPDRTPWPTTFDGLRTLLREAVGTLEAIDPDEFDALADARTAFVFGETELPFTGTNFLLSFSQPNFYFHATTAYAILRAEGLPLGKRDFIGRLRMAEA